MEKRVERNKELYIVVNEKIRQRALKTSNKDFEETQNKLKGINPGLFGGDVETVPNSKPNNKKKIIVTSIIFTIIFLIIIFVAVVISNV